MELIPSTSTSTHDETYGFQTADEEAETSFMGSDTKPLIGNKEDDRDEAWSIIEKKFPEMKPGKSPFTAKIDAGRVIVTLTGGHRNVPHDLFNPLSYWIPLHQTDRHPKH